MTGITLERTSLLCTLLLWIFQVCSGAITVKVTPKVEVNKGETAKLPCTYTGINLQDVVVEWYIESQGLRTRVGFRENSGKQMSDPGTPLTGRVNIEENLTLNIMSVKPSDELTYYCQVTAGKDGSGEGSTKLEVFVAPQKPEIKKPSSQAISVGNSESSEIGTCTTMNGFPAPRIIWFKDNQPLPEVKDKGEKTYMVPSTVREASGLYTIKSVLYMQPTKADKDSLFHCTVEYSLAGEQNKNIQMTSEPMKIELYYPSEKVMFDLLNATKVKEGDDVTIKCETDGNPQPSFEFLKDDKPLNGKDGLLTLKSVKRTDSGRYFCTAFDFDHLDIELKAEKVLDVNYIDQMSVTPIGLQVVMLGNKVEWQCKTKASKSHTVQWKKGSTVLSQDGTLSIESVTYDNAGGYLCVGAVPDVPGLTAQASVNLTVKGKPQIEHPEDGKVTKEGDEVTLKCSAYGFPTPQFTWTPSGKESISVEDNKVVSTVTLQATPDIMKDGVTCEVSNEHGKDSKTLLVSVKRANTAEVLLSGNPVLTSADKQQAGSSTVVVAVVVCVLLLLLLVALIYFVSKKTTFCSKKDKKEASTGQVNNIVVEMKTEKANEEAGLLNKKVNTEQ
ncbi:basal cell adhesion molecule isoform X1 [Girardinichthys multiradiatus]|uniref:basal cell adhesion molecule isoform X1 n=1 Tax=Girardinichthys multiradiatus TaxID=208333 RepID=UPI001FACD881|nr:basal cell adhesion molecule isoform X1 [Girardinichthys multiradiatus]